PGIPPLRHSAHLGSHLLFLRVVIHVKVLGLEHLEIQGLIADFVLPEILRGCRHAGQNKKQANSRPSYHWNSHFVHPENMKIGTQYLERLKTRILDRKTWFSSQLLPGLVLTLRGHLFSRALRFTHNER